jgi:hypothetical protein
VGESTAVLTGVVAESLAAEGGSLTTLCGYAETLTSTARGPAGALADVMHVDRVPVDSRSFDDPDLESLKIAHFCAHVRKRTNLPSVSVKGAYQDQTVRRLVKALTPDVPLVEASLPTVTLPVAKVDPAVLPVSAPAVVKPASRTEYVSCARLLLLTSLPYSFLAAIAADDGCLWISVAPSPGSIYLRSLEFGAAAVIGLCLLWILSKRLIIGRRPPREIRVWILGYVPFWIVTALVRSNPLLLFIGGRSRVSTTSPLNNTYLRAPGAKVGPDAARCTLGVGSLVHYGVTMGEGAILARDPFLMKARWGGNPAREIDGNRAAVEVGGK